MTPDENGSVVGFNTTLGPPTPSALSEGFNQYGVRENYDDDENLESIDVIFEAMEPGIRRGVEVTPEFLNFVATNSDPGSPVMLDHSSSQLAKVGNINEIKFSDNFLRLKVNIPNTGSSVKTDVIADFTHEPPDITDGSVGFDRDSVEFTDPESDDAHARFTEAVLKEFSLTPFPAGYDNGGISAQFSEMVNEYRDESSGKADDAESQLLVQKSQLEVNN